MSQPKSFSDIAEPFGKLTDRQQEVITLVCAGNSNKDVAARLGISGTVKIHLHAIFEMLGVRSRIELMIALGDRKRSKA